MPEKANMTRKALGKGLEALIPGQPAGQVETGKEQKEKGLVYLKIDQIKTNPYQPRTTVDQEKLAELSASISQKGIIQPVVVRQTGEGYELVAGERRFLAAKNIGLETIPAVLAGKLSKEETMELSLIENIQREDLNPIDTAIAYARLMDECLLTQQDLAQKIGKDRSSISNTLRLLGLPKEIQGFIAGGALSEGHARAILSLSTEKERINLSRRVIKEGLSVRRTEELVYGKKRTPASRSKVKVTPAFFEIEEKLKQLFGTSVKVKGKRKGGKIEVEFYSEDDLTRILELLGITL
jgi:ParB family chromosome partitioning protein